MTSPLLEADGLRKVFTTRSGVRGRHANVAVDDVTLSIAAGERVGLVGESGSGKSTVARLLLRLVEPTAGAIRFEGQDLMALPEAELRRLRRHMAMVFQNPHTSLHPRMTAAQSVAEPLRIAGGVGGETITRRVAEMFDLIGLPRSFRYRYPHELSGGQKQRISIARALILRPRLMILDEPTSALDVSVQAQILELLLSLQQELALAFLFISHNLAVVRYTCTRVLVMYRGAIVEQGETRHVLAQPAHPYTQSLLAATLDPVPGAKLPAPEVVDGDGGDAGSGCRYCQRCPRRMLPYCREVAPVPVPAWHGGQVACHAASDGPSEQGGH